jgi:hypothetical protein
MMRMLFVPIAPNPVIEVPRVLFPGRVIDVDHTIGQTVQVIIATDDFDKPGGGKEILLATGSLVDEIGRTRPSDDFGGSTGE